MRRNRKGFTVIELLICFFIPVIAFAVGCWIGNIVKLCKCDFEPSYKGEIVHAIGVVIPPAAMITVWFNDK